ncbi:surface lipoprotein assembly modifier [Sphingomonas sp. CD22]|uniref:surface lipoprotein assembly modifier n=1 Tax=Sphingomonas sp. CD22 TaxID=3100214 RepID=UPI002AE053BD|nr:surface lipoprotein assembly modifier [Sphingomonas sp. CD22]MEA1084437.1 surface lipoprotein assembly modifier [Sphingomonas sp. CD22]
MASVLVPRGVGIAGALLPAACPSPALAQQAGSGDTRLRLDQTVEQRKAEAETRVRDETDRLDPTSVEIDGTVYAVGRNANDTGAALYVSITRRRWADVRRFLARYRTLPGHEDGLILYAEGGLAREAGDMAGARRAYRALVAVQPDFLPGRLELARVLFLDRRDREAAQAFADVRGALLAQGDKAAGVVRTVDTFLATLRKRRGVQGMVSFGPEYTSNLNQSSASYTCLIPGAAGDCLFDRKVPDPIAARGINIEGNATLRLPLAGHDGVGGRALAFGDLFPGNGRYSQSALSLYAGYDRRTAATGVVLAPSFDLGTLGGQRLYDARGLHGEYSRSVGAGTLVRFEANLRDFTYRRDGYRDYDGRQADAWLTGFRTFPHGWTIFGGPDLLDKRAADPVNAYRQYGARLGLDRTIGEAVDLLLTASLRRREYGAFSPLLDARRRDVDQNYTMLARLPAAKLAGFSPSLLVQHSRVGSNVDWLYSYRRTSVSLRVDHVF